MEEQLLFMVQCLNAAVDVFRRNLADVFQCGDQVFNFPINFQYFLLVLFGDA